MASKKYFWIRKKGNYGKDIKFNDAMPPLGSDMEKHLLGLGYISTKKHDSFDSAQASALETVKKENAILGAESEGFRKKNILLESDNDELLEENTDLKNQIGDLLNANSENTELKTQVSELKAELEDFPKNVKEANKKIKELEKQISDLTNPGGK